MLTVNQSNYDFISAWEASILARLVGDELRVLVQESVDDYELGDEPLPQLRNLIEGASSNEAIGSIEIHGTSLGGETDELIFKTFRDSAVVRVRLTNNAIHFDVWGSYPEAAEKLAKALAGLVPQVEAKEVGRPKRIPVGFWTVGNLGPTCSIRPIDVPDLDAIIDNYPKKVRASLHALRELKAPDQKGKIIVWHGPPGCMAGDTELFYRRGKRNSGRKITLRSLFNKFNGVKIASPGRGRAWQGSKIPTKLHSVFPDGTARYNRIVKVWESGVKSLIRVMFSDGRNLRLTTEHPVMVPGGKFVQAGKLAVGATVVSIGSMKPQAHGGRDLAARPHRIVVNLKYHPGGAIKIVRPKNSRVTNDREYVYKRVPRARLVVEAGMNGLPYDDYITILKTDPKHSAKLKFLDAGDEVHHKDENTLNDSPSNLEVLTKKEHARQHCQIGNLAPDYTREVQVVGIESDAREMTYDIEMESPANNFAANGIFVHNTGKTTAIRALAKEWALDLGATVEVVLDPERVFGQATCMTEILVDKDGPKELHNAMRRRMPKPTAVDDDEDEDTDEAAPLRLIVLEDAGQFFKRGATDTPGFSRFLNMADGIVGQGLRCVFLLTANEHVAQLEPAIIRPGRCIGVTEFPQFSVAETRTWFKSRGLNAPKLPDRSLAGCFAALETQPPVEATLSG